jgi:membrane fusion protein (multidrug efflux system)
MTAPSPDSRPVVPPASPTPPAALAPHPQRHLSRLLWPAGLLGVAVLVGVFGWPWWAARQTHSITEDAFVEAHIVNVAPQSVSGHVVRFLVEENERVDQGQVLAEIDPVPYRDQVNIARSKVETARAELRRQEAGLARLRQEVPIQIEIARRTLAAAQADQAKAKEALKLTKDEVEKAIDEAQASLAAAKADLVLAEQEYTRYTTLEKEMASTLRRAQQVTQERDAATARRDLAVAKLAKFEAARTQIEVAKRTLEAAEKTTQKTAKGVDLAETGNAQIREVELLTAVKKEDVEDARQALEAAEDNLRYTRIVAPFPGVVVKR